MYAVPCIVYSIKQISTWMRIYSTLDQEGKSRVTKAWHKIYARLANNQDRWKLVKGPMSAVIAVLTLSKVRSQRSADGVWHSIPTV